MKVCLHLFFRLSWRFIIRFVIQFVRYLRGLLQPKVHEDIEEVERKPGGHEHQHDGDQEIQGLATLPGE